MLADAHLGSALNGSEGDDYDTIRHDVGPSNVSADETERIERHAVAAPRALHLIFNID